LELEERERGDFLLVLLLIRGDFLQNEEEVGGRMEMHVQTLPTLYKYINVWSEIEGKMRSRTISTSRST